MANKKISELTAVSSITGPEELAVVQGGVTKKATAAQVLASGTTAGLEVIAQTVVGAGGAASIDFTSIPQTFESLQLVMMGRGTAAAGGVGNRVRFNGDAAANYDSQSHNRQGATTAGGFTAAQTQGELPGGLAGATATAGHVGVADIIIPAYASSTFRKVWRGPGGRMESTATGVIEDVIGLWRSTAAITQVTVFPSSGSYVEGTTATLYGMKGV